MGGLAFALGTEAAAQGTPLTTTPTTSKPASTTAATLGFSSTNPVLVQTDATTWRTNVVVTVSSACPAGLSFWLVLPSTRIVPAHSASDGNPPCATSNWQLLPETLTFGALPGSPAAATLVVSQYGRSEVSSTAGGVATIQLTLQRILPNVDGLQFGWVVIAAAVFALLFLVPALAYERRRAGSVHLSEPVFASAAWTFKDSWATNITAVGALLATFLAASSSVTSLFPGVPLYRFSIANATCGAIVVIVPLVVAVSTSLTPPNPAFKPPKNDVVVASFGAVILGGTITMLAVGAELALFGILVDVSSATPGWTMTFLIVLGATAAIVLAYALITTSQLKRTGDAAAEQLTERAEHIRDARDAHRAVPDLPVDVVVSSALARSADTSLTL